DALAGRELVERLPRRPGQKEDRYRQLLGGSHLAEDPPAEAEGAVPQPAAADEGGDMAAGTPESRGQAYVPEPLPVPVDTPETERIETLERQVTDLDRQVSELADLVRDLREQLGA